MNEQTIQVKIHAGSIQSLLNTSLNSKVLVRVLVQLLLGLEEL